jgi:putative tryptophan/tyrosine transport system substrate-binding protein
LHHGRDIVSFIAIVLIVEGAGHMIVDLSRRKFIVALGGAASWPLAARAQQLGRLHKVAVLTLRAAEELTPYLAAFRGQLEHFGYVEGQSVRIDYRYADGDVKRLKRLAQELISFTPDVAFATDPHSVRAIKSIDPSLPIVCGSLSDAQIPELAASYARPGGSVTGIALTVEGLMGKLVELTLEIVPKVDRIGFLSNPDGASMELFVERINAAARALGVSVLIEKAKAPDDVAPALDRLTRRIQALIVPPNAWYLINRTRIAQLALAAHLPLIVSEREYVEVGGLASYGADAKENYRAAGAYVGRILNGSKPGDMPIEFSTKVELVINLKTAKMLGLAVSPPLLARADEVIE